MINLAKKLRSYFEENRNYIKLPFIDKFPRGCCEVTTLALVLAISKSKLRTAYLVGKGYDHTNDIHHFWLESDGSIIDITADQFGKELLYLSNGNWIHNKFTDYELIDPLEFISNNYIFLSNIKEFSRIMKSLKI
jgi:hypothetical protein